MRRSMVLRQYEEARARAQIWRAALESAWLDCVKNPTSEVLNVWIRVSDSAFNGWQPENQAASVSLYIQIDNIAWRSFHVFSAHCNKGSGRKYKGPYWTKTATKEQLRKSVFLWMRRTKLLVFNTKELSALFELNLLTSLGVPK